ncbi:MAG: phosphate signaling complex protein PhoU [Opitutales bacterium]
MRRYFHTELESLRTNLVRMGELTIEITRLAIESLVKADAPLASEVIDMDESVDSLELMIDRESIRYISLRSPVASDLRLLTTAMKASHDLERVGDEATGIAKRARNLALSQPPRLFYRIPELADMSLDLLRDALDSFIDEDLTKALTIPRRDKQIDAVNRDNYDLLKELIADNPSLCDQAIELIFVSRSLERIGDHAKNIAEEVIFLLSGEDVRYGGQAARESVRSQAG